MPLSMSVSAAARENETKSAVWRKQELPGVKKHCWYFILAIWTRTDLPEYSFVDLGMNQVWWLHGFCCVTVSCRLYYGVMERDLAEICSDYMAYIICVSAEDHHPENHLQGLEVSYWICCAPGFVWMSSTGHFCSKLTSLFLRRAVFVLRTNCWAPSSILWLEE